MLHIYKESQKENKVKKLHHYSFTTKTKEKEKDKMSSKNLRSRHSRIDPPRTKRVTGKREKNSEDDEDPFALASPGSNEDSVIRAAVFCLAAHIPAAPREGRRARKKCDIA